MVDCENESWPECVECGEEFNPKRKALGYHVCLECGDSHAKKSIAHKKKCSAPLFNKGGGLDDALEDVIHIIPE